MAKKTAEAWKEVLYTDTKISFHLTGESVIRAVTIPAVPTAKAPTVIRVTHHNSYAQVDADIFVRLGDPKKPLGPTDFDTVKDWQPAKLVENLAWNAKKGDWEPLRGRAKQEEYSWSGTYEAELQFSKGAHQIEIKVISRVPQVCSIVLSNWKVTVR
jgi:hypothetical protein